MRNTRTINRTRLLTLLIAGAACLSLAACATVPRAPVVRRPPDPNRDPGLPERISRRFGECRLERTCGELIGVDCQSASDGPYFYVNAKTLKTVASCGGNCMTGPCPDCPPPQWDCEEY